VDTMLIGARTDVKEDFLCRL